MNNSLLPFNATKLEKSVEATLHQRTSSIPLPLRTLWDPLHCPEKLLPWLAWALSVDTWDSRWPASTKRQLIADSIGIHRIKGTVSAIECVLSALGVEAELAEWFEYDGEPHTFELTAWANANLTPDAEVIFNAAFYRALKHSIDNVKPARSHYDFRVGAAFDGGLGIGGNVSTACVAQVVMQPQASIGFNASPIAVGANVVSISVVRILMEST